ncbi:CCL3 protein, partial [Drymodes brunneopygia]|nr:CCL3 protein [Drymodes brunneopygia]
KTLGVAVAVLQLGSHQGSVFVSLALTDGIPNICCFSYQRQPIPRRRVTSVFVTSSSCIHPGVIVVTKRKQLCADPQAAWVQELLKHFKSVEN